MSKNYGIINLELIENEPISQQPIFKTSKLTHSQNRILENGYVTYIYYNLTLKKIYIGATKQFKIRHDQHLNDSEAEKFLGGKYNQCLIIYNQSLFTKSHVLDLEFMIINHMLAETDVTGFEILNGNNGEIQPDYNDAIKMKEIFIDLWTTDLVNEKLVYTTDLSQLTNKILFKYSPFKTLSSEQATIRNEIIGDIDKKEYHKYKIIGGAGTGKTILLMSLMYTLINKNPDLKIGLVTTSNLIQNYNGILKCLKLSRTLKFERPHTLIQRFMKEGFSNQLDIILVDESHRLERYYPKGQTSAKKYLGEENELSMLEKCSHSIVLFYDEFQSFRPHDIPLKTFNNQTKDYKEHHLTRQFRIGMGIPFDADSYVKGIKYALNLSADKEFNPDVFKYVNEDSYFKIVNSISELFEYTHKQAIENANSINRVLAGCANRWQSNPNLKKNKGKKQSLPSEEWNGRIHLLHDWVEGENRWYWNRTHKSWITSDNSKNEVGCIHAIQGVDLDFVGVIIGTDLSIDESGNLIGNKNNYTDSVGIPVKSGFDNEEFTQYIEHIYYVLLTRGINGCRVYFQDEKVKDYFVKKLSEGTKTTK